MFHACVWRFDVMGTMQIFLELIKALVGIAIARSMQYDGKKKAIAACSNLLTLLVM